MVNSKKSKKPTKKVVKKPTKKVVKKPTKKVVKKPTKKVTKKPVHHKTTKKVIKKPTKKVTKKPVHHKTIKKVTKPKHIVHKEEHVKPKSKREQYKNKKKDIVTIIILIILIAAIVAVSFIFPAHNTNVTTNTKITDNNTPVTTPTDVNKTIDINKDAALQAFNKKSVDLQLKVFSEIENNQLAVLQSHYQDINLDANAINSCMNNNNLIKDLNLQTPIINKLKADALLAASLNIKKVPQMYVGGFEISNITDGNYASDYKYVSSVIDLAKSSPVVDFNYSNKSYENDLNKPAKLIIIANTSNKLLNDNLNKFEQLFTNSSRLTPEIKTFFSSLFSELPITVIPYDSPSIKSLVESTGIIQLPAVIITGNVPAINLLNDKNKSQIFYFVFDKKQTGIYSLNPQIISQLIKNDNIQPLLQLTTDEMLNNKDDYKIGVGSTNMYVFCDPMYLECKSVYDNVYSPVIKNYVDTGKITLINKDFVSNELVSLYPILFTRCAQKQNHYMDSLNLVYKQNSELDGENTVKPVIDKYQTEINELNKEYQELTAKK